MKRKFIIAFTLCIVLIFGLVVSGCKKQEIALNRADPAGVYTLVSVNGNRVPASISHEGVALQVRSGTFIINADHTCSSKTVFVPPAGTEVTREVTATYKSDGSRLTMQWKGAGITVGTIQGNIFTMDNEGMVFVYKK
jgi:hypothetical protein